MATRPVRRTIRPRPPIEPSLPAGLDEAMRLEHDLIGLSYTLAHALGIHIDTGDDE
ncbi:MAG TPA: hypothetical protein VFX60_07880 [Micromonospora sp.]|nr:hypothetical protein [Micromonospora sp.]